MQKVVEFTIRRLVGQEVQMRLHNISGIEVVEPVTTARKCGCGFQGCILGGGA